MEIQDRLRIGKVELKNRFVLAPVKTALNAPGGQATPQAESFYRRIAEGGTALLILEPAAVSPEGVEHPRQLRIHQDAHVEQLARLVRAAHEGGGLAAVHLNHAGRAANPKAIGGAPVAPTAMTCPATGAEAVALTEDQILRILDDFEAAARRAAQTGADFIELQCGHGYLVSQFYSPRTNKRDDSWGHGDLFVTEVVNRVMKGAQDLPVMVRVSGMEFVEKGLDPENQAGLFRLLESKGAAALHIGFGNACDNPAWYFGHMALPEEPQYRVLKQIRSQVSLPLLAAGRMGYPDRIDKVLRENLADGIALARPLIADPDFPQKMIGKEPEKIMLCGACLQACLRKVKSTQPIACMANPWVTMPAQEPAKEIKKVMVVGSGPAGIGAAVSAAQRGHRVVLHEQKENPGGQFAFAVMPTGKTTMSRVLKGMLRRLKDSQVSIHMNSRVTPKLVKQEHPDVLILATGSQPKIPQIDGIQSQNLMTSYEFFEKTRQVKGERVLVVGAGMVGLEVAEMLLADGKEVVACRRSSVIGADMDPISKKLMMSRVGDNPKLSLMPDTTLMAFSTEGVKVLHQGEQKLLKPFGTVILCSGMAPERSLADALGEFGGEMHIIGDALEPANIETAYTQGLSVGSSL